MRVNINKIEIYSLGGCEIYKKSVLFIYSCEEKYIYLMIINYNMVMKQIPRWSEVLNDIVEKIKEYLSTTDKVEVTFRNILRNYNVSFTTAYVIFVRLEKVLYDTFGNSIEIYRRKGKLIIVKKKENKEEDKGLEEEEKKIEELKKHYSI